MSGREALLPPSLGLPTIVYDEESGLAVPAVAMWMVCLTMFLDTLAATISVPVMPYYAKEFGVGNAGVGYLFAAWSVTSTLFAPMLSHISDRIGRRTVLLMSLVGAGVASLGQGLAPNFAVFFAMRAFSGVWAAVGSTAQVYIADICSPATLPSYMARISAVPGAAMIFGPGLGGGLSKFGLNIPILVDGVVCLAAAGLVYIYLPESPVWQAGQKQSTGEGASGAAKARTKPPNSVFVLGLSNCLQGIAFSTSVSMLAVSLGAKFDFDSLKVGYSFVVFALVFLCTSIWLTTRVQKLVGLQGCALLGSGLSALGFALFGVQEGVWVCLFWMSISRMGTTLGMSTRGTLATKLCDSTNRGAVFGRLQLMTNCGRLIGPIVAGNLAEHDPKTAPWLFAGLCSVLSGLVLALVQPPPEPKAKAPEQPKLVRGFTGVAGDGRLEIEEGSPEDFEAMGRFIGDLLTKRRYRWISRREAVCKTLEALLPELSESAQEHERDIERLLRHARSLHEDFGEHHFR